jgi:hypothetical protein
VFPLVAELPLKTTVYVFGILLKSAVTVASPLPIVKVVVVVLLGLTEPPVNYQPENTTL